MLTERFADALPRRQGHLVARPEPIECSVTVKIQQNILEGRKLEAELARQQDKGSAEAKEMERRLTQIKAELQEQKKTFKELNSPNFPKTPLTALGAACTDRRWAERAKEILVKQPDKLGRAYFIWIDSKSREFKAAEQRPRPEAIAR